MIDPHRSASPAERCATCQRHRRSADALCPSKPTSGVGLRRSAVAKIKNWNGTSTDPREPGGGRTVAVAENVSDVGVVAPWRTVASRSTTGAVLRAVRGETQAGVEVQGYFSTSPGPSSAGFVPVKHTPG
jgi:hypothetical protein